MNQVQAEARATTLPSKDRTRPILAALDHSVIEHVRDLKSVLDPSSDLGKLALQQMADLQAEILALRKALDLPHSKLHTLSEDLMVYIFREVQSLLPLCKGASLVSQVCRRWREIALNNAKLWADMKIDLRKRGALDNMNLLLKRSSQADLSIILNCTVRRAGQRRGEEQPRLDISHVQRAFMAPIMGERHRLQTFHLVVQDERQLTTIAQCMQNQDFASLETLRCVTNSNDRIMDWVQGDDITGAADVATGGAPRLRTIDLRGCDILAFKPPLHAITSMHLSFHRDHEYTYNQMSCFISQAPCLETLHLRCIKVPAPPNHAFIDAPNLHKITMNQVSIVMLQYLKAPKLAELELIYCFRQDDAPVFIQKEQYPSLQELMLSACFGADPNQFRPFFMSIPMLRTLKLPRLDGHAEHGVQNGILDILIADEKRSTVLPVLERIVVDGISQHALVALGSVASGVEQPTQMPALTVDAAFVSMLNESYPGAMAWFKAQGIVVDEEAKQQFNPWMLRSGWGQGPTPWEDSDA